MTRSRGLGEEIRAPECQHHPRFLLYHVGAEWHSGTLDSVHHRMAAAAPPDVCPGLRAIWSGGARQHEASAVAAARWIGRDGTALGFRTPNAEERARATGRAAYVAALGLTARQLYDLVGDHSDPDALLVRIAGPLRAWLLHGDRPAPPAPLAPDAVLRAYAQLRRQVIRGGCPRPVWAIASRPAEPLLTAAIPPSAAEPGRGAQ